MSPAPTRRLPRLLLYAPAVWRWVAWSSSAGLGREAMTAEPRALLRHQRGFALGGQPVRVCVSGCAAAIQFVRAIRDVIV